MSDQFRFVVHRARHHAMNWCVPGFSARPTLAAALELATDRSKAHAVYVHELTRDGYRAVAHVELGRITRLVKPEERADLES